MKDPRITRLAETLVDCSTRVRMGDLVLIDTDPVRLNPDEQEACP